MRRIFGILAIGLALAAVPAVAQDTSNLDSSDLVRVTRVDANGVGTPGAIAVNNVFDGTGIGYNSGSAVTQITNRTTGVTINAYAGAITLVSAAGSATPASFTVTNSAVGIDDVIILNQRSGTDLLELHVTDVAAGSFQVTFFTTGGTTSETPVINFAVVRAAAS